MVTRNEFIESVVGVGRGETELLETKGLSLGLREFEALSDLVGAYWKLRTNFNILNADDVSEWLDEYDKDGKIRKELKHPNLLKFVGVLHDVARG
jgi:hypothetical protein